MSKISFVIPTRNEEAGIPNLMIAIDLVHSSLEIRGHQLEVIIVDNHSSDQTVKFLKQTKFRENFQVSLYALNRNYGLQRSILFGMTKSTGDALIVFQSDLQDPIEAAMQMITEWENGAKVVAGISNKRQEKLLNLITSGIFYKTINFVTDIRILQWFQDFFLLDKEIYTDLSRRINHYEFLRGRLVEEYGINSVVYYKRLARKTGRSNYNFAGRYGTAMDGITRFGSKIIRRFVIFGALLFTLSSVIFLTNLLLFIATGQRYFGNVLIWLVILLLGITVFALGLILEYLVRLLKITSTSSTEILYRTVNILNETQGN